MSNPRGYAELSKFQMNRFLVNFAHENDFHITDGDIHQLTNGIFDTMKKSYIKLDTARDYYAFARHNNNSFANFVAQNKC